LVRCKLRSSIFPRLRFSSFLDTILASFLYFSRCFAKWLTDSSIQMLLNASNCCFATVLFFFNSYWRWSSTFYFNNSSFCSFRNLPRSVIAFYLLEPVDKVLLEAWHVFFTFKLTSAEAVDDVWSEYLFHRWMPTWVSLVELTICCSQYLLQVRS
jgi:hypothetical protein